MTSLPNVAVDVLRPFDIGREAKRVVAGMDPTAIRSRPVYLDVYPPPRPGPRLEGR